MTIVTYVAKASPSTPRKKATIALEPSSLPAADSDEPMIHDPSLIYEDLSSPPQTPVKRKSRSRIDPSIVPNEKPSSTASQGRATKRKMKDMIDDDGPYNCNSSLSTILPMSPARTPSPVKSLACARPQKRNRDIPSFDDEVPGTETEDTDIDDDVPVTRRGRSAKKGVVEAEGHTELDRRKRRKLDEDVLHISAHGDSGDASMSSRQSAGMASKGLRPRRNGVTSLQLGWDSRMNGENEVMGSSDNEPCD